MERRANADARTAARERRQDQLIAARLHARSEPFFQSMLAMFFQLIEADRWQEHAAALLCFQRLSGFPRRAFWSFPVNANAGRDSNTASTARTASTDARETVGLTHSLSESVGALRTVDAVPEKGEALALTAHHSNLDWRDPEGQTV